MDPAIRQEIEILRKLKLKELKFRFRGLFGEESPSSNQQHLFRRIAWRLQAGSRRRSQRPRTPARRRAAEPRMWDLRLRAPAPVLARQAQQQKRAPKLRVEIPRLPAVGTVLQRDPIRAD